MGIILLNFTEHQQLRQPQSPRACNALILTLPKLHLTTLNLFDNPTALTLMYPQHLVLYDVPRSLPKPDCLKPPKGAATSVLLYVFTKQVPASKLSATRRAWKTKHAIHII